MTQNKTILIVDDDRSMLEIIEFYLIDFGYSVYKANTGEAALKIFVEKKPDIIISDLNMPAMSGLQLLEVFKNEAPRTPIIILTAANDIKDAEDAIRLGAWEYIIKPFSHIILEKTINKVLEKLKALNENNKKLG